jgi:outer membrane protein assembly factor BamB
MTDEELLQLVDNKSPGELSLDEIQTLRTRLAESAELRTAFSSRLRLQTFLAEVLARIDLAPDDVLRTNSHERQPVSRGAMWKWATLFLLTACIATIFGVPQLRERLRATVHQLTGKDQHEVVDRSTISEQPIDPDVESSNPDERTELGPTTTPGDDLPATGSEKKDDAAEEKDSVTGADSAPPTDPATTLAVTPPKAAEDLADAPPPWHAASVAKPVRSLDSILFQRFDTRRVLPQASDLHRWFDVIVGEPKGIVETRSKHGQCGAIEGILRLNAPWTNDSILRLQLESYKQLQMHFFVGQQGLTLVYHADQPERWAAYVTTRKPAGFTPQTWQLTANDGGRNRRTQIGQGGPYQLRHRRGELLLSRGDVVVIRAPLAELPDDVFFQGSASIVGIDWVRVAGAADGMTKDDPSEVVAANAPVVRTIRAADFAWQPQLDPKSSLTISPGDTIRLESTKATKRSWCTIWRPRDDLSFIDLELEDATAGAGIYLGDIASPKWVLRYVRDNRTGQLCMMARGTRDDHRAQDFPPLHVAMLPSVGGRHWVRLVYGSSMIRWWLSVDGRHWAEAEPLRNPPTNLTHLGLHCVTNAECGVTLRRIRLTPLTAITALADPHLRHRVWLPDAAKAPKDIADWIAQTTELQPSGSSINAWRRSAAVQTLASGCPAPLGIALLDLLLDDAAARELPLEEQLRLLDQAALLADLYDNQQRLQAWVDRYHRLGLAAAAEHDGRAFSSIRTALMRSPINTIRPIDVFHSQAIGEELVQLVYAGDWPRTARFCQKIRFFHLQAKVPLFEWSEMAAAKRTPEGLSKDLLTRLPETWRNMLIERQSKDVYNVAAELLALLDSDAFDDAARMIARLDPRHLPGIAVDERDDRLLASLPALITMADRRHPQLRTAVVSQQAALADLRLREQMAQHDADGVALVALQFPGTTAVSKAHAWLGDRALTSGWFETALWHYRRASQVSIPIDGPDLGSRVTMSKIMLGSETHVGTPPLRLGDIQLKIEEIVAIEANRRAEMGMDSGRFEPNGFAGPHLLTAAPTEFVVHKRARLDGSVGQDTNRVTIQNVNDFRIDWANRQLAVSIDDQRMYVSNRFQVAAYDRKSGARAWQSPQLPGRVRKAHEWSLTAMRPVLHGERIYARQMYGDTVSLVCLDKSTGQPIWTAIHRRNIDNISDPMIIQDRLVCLTMARTSQLESVVRFTEFDPETGTLWHERDLVTLSNAWQRRQVCEVQTIRDGIIAVLGGVVISCDVEGQLRWVSRQILLPPDEQPDWVTQTFSPPLVFSDTHAAADGQAASPGDRIFVTEPGVRALQCLDAETGDLIWSRTLPDLRRLLGISGGCLIAHGRERLLGLDPATGETRWLHPIEPLLHGHLCGGEHGILVARRQPIDEKKTKFVPELVWLDGRTGKETHSTRLDGLEDADPRLGPMVVIEGQVWTFFGRGPRDPYRDVIQLTPTAIPAASSPPVTADDPWKRHLPEDQRRALKKKFPDWSLLGGIQAKGTGIVAEVHGEKEVLSLATRKGVPLILGRSLEIPIGAQPRLRLVFGSEVNRPGQIEVRFQGVTVWKTEITPKSHTTPWKTIDVDLQSVSGASGWLTVHARFDNGNNPVLVAWKQLDLVF